MALINHAKKEINAKLVFFGPGMAGKATNLNYIYRKLKPEYRGSFKSMNIDKDRMLFFDFVPAGQASLDDYTVRFHVYTLNGEVGRSSAWKMVLKGVDGVVFVADSAPERMAANQASLKDLHGFLGGYGKSLQDVPSVIQANKQDMDGAVSLEELQRTLNRHALPLFPAAARKGEGVLECTFSLVKMVLKNLRASGLELDRDADHLRSVVTEPASVAGVTVAAVEEAAAVTEAVIAPSRPTQSITPIAGQAGGPELEIAGEPTLLADGRLRLPLAMKIDGQERKVFLTVAVSLENE